MKGNKLTHKFWARAIAFCLFCVFAAVLIGCIAGVLYCYSEDWYDMTVSGAAAADIPQESVEPTAPPTPSPQQEESMGEFSVESAEAEPLPASEFAQQEGNLSLKEWEKMLLMNRYRLIIIGFIAGAAMLGLFIFLLCSAAHKEGEEGYVLIRQDKVPFDLYLLLCVAAVLICSVPFNYAAYSNASSGTIIAVIIIGLLSVGGLAAIGMALCMTVAARIKTGMLFKNTIIYRVFAWTGRIIDKLAVHYKAGLIFIAFILINGIMAAYMFASRYSGFAFAMLLFFNAGALYFVLKMAGQMNKLKEAGKALAEGNLAYETDTSKLSWEFKAHGENLNSISRGMARAVSERMRSERFKTELITNVSHDLKTPLTSIVTYADLLQKENIPGERAKEYVDTIARQSAKLKRLTEDLIDASKASSGAMNVNFEMVNVSELMRQSSAEYGERMAAAGITPVVSMPEEDIYITADGRLLWRVVDNLLTNICRHGMAGTRAYLGAEAREGDAVISFKNISARQLNIPAEELMERFVQGDESRNTEGSGLGLSIAESLTELMKGKINLSLDGDLFKVELIFPGKE